MYNKVHTDFILSPLLDVVNDGLNACEGVADGIESYPMKEYFFQSLFLKMTGAQEQKMKCICWELATNNYQYRYDYLNSKNYGECSKYKDKNDIFQDVISLIKEMLPGFSYLLMWEDVPIDAQTFANKRSEWEAKIRNNYAKQAELIIKKQEEKGKSLSEEVKNRIRQKFIEMTLPENDFLSHISTLRKEIHLSSVLSKYLDILSNSKISTWAGIEYEEYVSILHKKVVPRRICRDGNLFDSSLQELYNKVVYSHRNRCAHNTISYQQNLPSLDILNRPEFTHNNYFLRFILLVIIDEVFMRAYKVYIRCLKD